MAAYTEEFQKLDLRSRVKEVERIKVTRYLNGLMWSIQHELSLFSLTTLQNCFQMARNMEDRLRKKGDSSSKGKCKGRDSKSN